MFYKNLIEVSPSVMTTHLMSSFHIDATTLGNLAASYFYAYLIMQIPAGLLIDRFGPHRVTSGAIALCAVGAFIFAGADTTWMAGVGRFLSGVGAAFAAINCLKLISNWFTARQFAFMAGLMMTVGMLGAVGGQAPLSSLIDSLGWRGALQLVAFAGGVLAVLFWLFVRDRAPHHKEVRLTPKRADLIKDCKAIFTSRQSWFLSAYSGLAFAPVSVFGGLWGVPFLRQAYGFSSTFAAHQVSLIFIGFACGAPFWGWLSDRLGLRKVVMMGGTILSFACVCTFLYVPNLPTTLVSILLFVFGTAISGFLLCFTMIREINPIGAGATAVGFMNAFDALFGAFSDPLAGKILDMQWEGAAAEGARLFPLAAYKWALLTLPLYLLLAIGFLIFIKEVRPKPNYPSTLP